MLAPPEDEVGELAIHRLHLAKQLILTADDRPVHLLGDVYEASFMVEGDERKTASLGASDHLARHVTEVPAQLDDQSGDFGIGELVDVAGAQQGTFEQAHSGRQQ